jgi:hypothetical protein
MILKMLAQVDLENEAGAARTERARKAQAANVIQMWRRNYWQQ